MLTVFVATRQGAGSTCMDGPDFSSFNFKNGDEVTVMMTYQSGAAATNYCASHRLS